MVPNATWLPLPYGGPCHMAANVLGWPLPCGGQCRLMTGSLNRSVSFSNALDTLKHSIYVVSEFVEYW